MKQMIFVMDNQDIVLNVDSTLEISIYTREDGYPFDCKEFMADLTKVHVFGRNPQGIHSYQEDDRMAYDDNGRPMYNVQLKTILK